VTDYLTGIFSVVALLAAGAGASWLLADLRTLPSGGGLRTGAAVSVVIPARDEESTLPALLDSLQRLTVEVRDVVVVDDDSRDSTASVARAAGAHVVVRHGVPEPGWTGKAWACHVGASATSGELLLFLDADVVLAPDALAGLLEVHHQHGGLVSVQPFHRVVRPYEQLSANFNAVSLMASAAFTRHRVGGRPMAFGPCLLTSREDYERAGGHAAVRGEILDDVKLAAAYDRAGLPVRCFVGGRSIWMRSYPGGIRNMADGWTKNVASGASAAAPPAALAAVLWVSAHHAVGVGATSSLVEVMAGAPLTHGHPVLWAVAWVGVAWQLRSILGRIGSFRWWTWLLFPVPLVAFDLIFARSVVLTAVRRQVGWRGRKVDLRRHDSAEEVP
jgi:4,4'-diaponeurosporenoate glycosyltransferase